MSENNDFAPIAAAIKAALVAAFADAPIEIGVYDLDEVPGTNGLGGEYPEHHVAIGISRAGGPGESRRGSGSVTISLKDLKTEAHSNSIGNLREIRRRVVVALEDVALPLPDGDHVGPFRYAIGEREDDDDHGWVGPDYWTFA